MSCPCVLLIVQSNCFLFPLPLKSKSVICSTQNSPPGIKTSVGLWTGETKALYVYILWSIRFCKNQVQLLPVYSLVIEGRTKLYCSPWMWYKFSYLPIAWLCCSSVSLLYPILGNPWTAAHEASLSFTISWSFLKLMSIEPVMPSTHLILCHPLLLLPSIFPASWYFPMSQVFASGSKNIGASASASVHPMKIQA